MLRKVLTGRQLLLTVGVTLHESITQLRSVLAGYLTGKKGAWMMRCIVSTASRGALKPTGLMVNVTQKNKNFLLILLWIEDSMCKMVFSKIRLFKEL